MKKLLSLCAVLMMMFTAGSAFAATDVSGTWNAEYTSPDGSVVLDFVCTLKQDGTKVTGSFAGPQGDSQTLTIADGKMDGEKFSFNVTYNGMVIHHEGTVNGDEIKLSEKSDSADFGGGSMTLKRAKAAAPSTAPPTPPAAN